MLATLASHFQLLERGRRLMPKTWVREAFLCGGFYDVSWRFYPLRPRSAAEMSPLRKYVNFIVHLSINIFTFHALI